MILNSDSDHCKQTIRYGSYQNWNTWQHMWKAIQKAAKVQIKHSFTKCRSKRECAKKTHSTFWPCKGKCLEKKGVDSHKVYPLSDHRIRSTHHTVRTPTQPLLYTLFTNNAKNKASSTFRKDTNYVSRSWGALKLHILKIQIGWCCKWLKEGATSTSTTNTIHAWENCRNDIMTLKHEVYICHSSRHVKSCIY